MSEVVDDYPDPFKLYGSESLHEMPRKHSHVRQNIFPHLLQYYLLTMFLTLSAQQKYSRVTKKQCCGSERLLLRKTPCNVAQLARGWWRNCPPERPHIYSTVQWPRGWWRNCPPERPHIYSTVQWPRGWWRNCPPERPHIHSTVLISVFQWSHIPTPV